MATGLFLLPLSTHRIYKRKLLEGGNKLGSVNCTLWERMVVKFYGADIMDETTKGLAWEEIAVIIDDYIQV
jgi:hypothetical protein